MWSANISVEPVFARFDEGLAPARGSGDLPRSSAEQVCMDPARPIRIIVVNGHVTLYGAVDSTMDKTVAGMRAGQVSGAFSVENKLVVEKDSGQSGM